VPAFAGISAVLPLVVVASLLHCCCFLFVVSQVMSIAASVLVRPSWRLCCLQAGFIASVAGVGLGLGQPLLLAAALAACLGWQRRLIRARLDINGVGQWRLAVYQQLCSVQLLGGSTVWPGLLCLLLADAGGRRWQLLLAPDSLTDDGWRRLQVALQAVSEKT
jgi:hypothetical protein